MTKDVVDLNSRRPHTHGRAICTECKHKWDAVILSEYDNELLECPACELYFGVFRGPRVPATFWRCNCGGSLYYLTREGPRCRSCGILEETRDGLDI